MEKIVDALAGALWDLVILAGGMAIAWGAGLIYPPAGIITAGVLAVAAGVLGALSEPAQKESGEDGDGG